MKQEEIAKWLTWITYSIGMAGAVVFFFLVPIVAGQMRLEYPEAAWLYWPGLGCNFLVAAGCYLILYQFWTVCREIGRDNSFSMENAQAFKRISRIAAGLAVVWFLALAGLTVVHALWAGILLFLFFAVFISFAVAICAAALSHLVWKAYEMKQENELTI